MMRQVQGFLVVVSLVLLAESVLAAGKITTLAASPTTVNAGQPTTLSIGHAGEKCGFLVLTGTGATLGPLAVGGGGTTVPVTYPGAGTFSVQLTGKKKNSHPKCQVLAPPVTVTVQATGSPRPGLGSRALDVPSKTLGKPGVPPLVDSDKLLEGSSKPVPDLPKGLRPKIRSVWFVEAGSIGSAAPGAVAPGGRLHASGERFGSQQGTLFLKGNGSKFPQYPSGKVPLEILKWTDEKVEGRVPKGMTGPIELEQIEVFVRRADQALSGGRDMRFGVPVETRRLKATDPEIRVISCGSGSGTDSCTPGSQTRTLSGYHYNLPLDGGSSGVDQFAIHLDDGWVFSKLTKIEAKVTGNDGDYLKSADPPLPVGKSSWVTKFSWKATADDWVRYNYEVEVIRPKGVY